MTPEQQAEQLRATRRYYVCEVPEVFMWGELQQIPAVALHPYIGMSCTSNFPDTSWGIAIVNAIDHAPIIADPRNMVLPDYPLDTPIADMPADEIQAINAGLPHFGVAPVNLQSVTLYREILRAIGEHAQAGFHEDNLRV